MTSATTMATTSTIPAIITVIWEDIYGPPLFELAGLGLKAHTRLASATCGESIAGLRHDAGHQNGMATRPVRIEDGSAWPKIATTKLVSKPINSKMML